MEEIKVKQIVIDEKKVYAVEIESCEYYTLLYTDHKIIRKNTWTDTVIKDPDEEGFGDVKDVYKFNYETLYDNCTIPQLDDAIEAYAKLEKNIVNITRLTIDGNTRYGIWFGMCPGNYHTYYADDNKLYRKHISPIEDSNPIFEVACKYVNIPMYDEILHDSDIIDSLEFDESDVAIYEYV